MLISDAIWPQDGPRMTPNDGQINSNSCPNHAQIMSKSCPSHAQIMPKSCPVHAQRMPKSPKIIQQSSRNQSKKCILPAWFLENLNPNCFSCPDSKSLWKISMKIGDDHFGTRNLKVVVTKTWNFPAFLAFLVSHFELGPCTCVYLHIHMYTNEYILSAGQRPATPM